MSIHRRSFHLHAHQDTADPTMIRWRVYRSLWVPREATRSAQLGFGEIQIEVLRDLTTPAYVARTVLELAIRDFGQQVDAGQGHLLEF
jgi:hypothetical protein